MISIIKKLKMNTKGMECHSCEKRIESAIRNLDGVKSVKSDYSTETTEVEYDEKVIDENTILRAVESCGYSIGNKNQGLGRFGTFAIALGGFAILAGVYLLFGKSISLDYNISSEAGFAALFILGFLTGFHCIGMCGGFVLAYAGNLKKTGDLKPHLLYGVGKTASYTAIGALFGIAGSLISFTPELRGGIALLAGAFLVIYGLNMLNILPILRKLQLRLPSFIPSAGRNRGPLATGLLNGFMIACGPLQALYIFAAGTGSAIAGAQALFFFGLGTLVPLLTFGIASNFLSAALSNRIVKFSGALVILLGLAMASNGLNLLGVGIIPAEATDIGTTNNQINITLADDNYQVIRMEVTAYGWEPNNFILKRGVPVRWEIDVKELTGCNNEIIVPEYGLDIKLREGLQTVEFTPEEEGAFRWSCWMGMIPGQFVVTDNIEAYSGENAEEIPQAPISGGCTGSCGGGCGGGCGGC